MGGSLHLILGPMFSGKTSRLIQIYKTTTYIGKRVMVINYLEDTRYHNSMMCTHDNIMLKCALIKNIGDVWRNPTNEFYEEIHNADVVLLNEGQFFGNLFSTVLEMVEKSNKDVYICGLDGDYQRNIFGELTQLIPYCDSIVKLTSLCSHCKDGTPALFSYRTSLEKEQKVIGATNYEPLCRKCYVFRGT